RAGEYSIRRRDTYSKTMSDKPKKEKPVKEAAAEESKPKAAKAAAGPKTPARLKEHYSKNIVAALSEEFGYANVMAVPKIIKISLNVGMGEATQNSKLIDGAVNELTMIAGQKPVITKARKSIAAFKLRENMPIGVTVTLRGDRMYEFF